MSFKMHIEFRFSPHVSSSLAEGAEAGNWNSAEAPPTLLSRLFPHPHRLREILFAFLHLSPLSPAPDSNLLLPGGGRSTLLGQGTGGQGALGPSSVCRRERSEPVS